MLGRIRTAVLWILALLFIVITFNSNEPYLVRLRGTGHAALLIIGLAAPLLLLLSGRWQRGLAGRLLVLTWCLPLLALTSTQFMFGWRKYETFRTAPDVARVLGQHFIVGYTATEDAAALARQGLIAGVYVTHHNVRGRTAAHLRADIARLQGERMSAGLPPLLVSADQEGGSVAHLSPILPNMPALATLADLPAARRTHDAFEMGRSQGQSLAAAGITFNLAPVVDLRPSWTRNRFDFHTLIGRRAISNDPAVVGDIALGYVRGLEASGVRAAVKHFPGLGRVQADTHHFSAQLDTPADVLEQSDWRPFRAVLDNSDAAMMVGHVVVDTIDRERPASHSKAVLDGLIRGRWNYRGVIVTDDLVMGAIYGRDLCKAVVEALNGGADLLLVAYDGTQFHRVFACAKQALAQGRIDLEALRRSEERLRRWMPRDERPLAADASTASMLQPGLHRGGD
ncbi:beta-hexosaminidase [Bradyrhizobium sp. SSBR45G]|uniref:glycoside hydrolase family 3 N-terminal domain-containing protein n=1 Tax=unclassified Bradyrhizobium TaxID=2631580 RepID=UPI002342B4CF|nr:MULTISPECIES: glycoside hydrolase family 3 N-terminal domain-containing protein [unclassified Bradyrhizobium]GLH75621.1 beta-hexosaminidase [Bradyrhizobium sp. SSBR45G]GLH82589.1 beta-hexosaminidase [Bradyrhizobium sp. SSBR45R]